MKLGVNVDHIATLRQARRIDYPDPLKGALIAQKAGADSIVMHLREDRRHIQEKDVFLAKKSLGIPLNLEMGASKEIVAIALKLKPYQVTLVPEKRKELTTEGGLDLIKFERKITSAVKKFKKVGVRVSLFIDPLKKQIDKAGVIGADAVELHTGRYANAVKKSSRLKELERVKQAARYAKRKKFFVAAGHGLNYENTLQIAKIKEIEELNIGHAIISQAVFLGLEKAVRKMRRLINSARKRI